jgi:hypothetical protein
LIATSDWQNTDGGEATTTITVECSGESYAITTNRTTVQFQFETQDPLAWYALNSELRLIASGSTQSAAIFTRNTQQSHVADMELTEEQNGIGDQEDWWKVDDYDLWYNDVGTYDVETTCQYVDAGVDLDAGELGSSDIAVGSIPGPSIGNRVTKDYTPSKSKTIEVINTRHMILDIPTEA